MLLKSDRCYGPGGRGVNGRPPALESVAMAAEDILIGRSLRDARRRRGLTLKAVAQEAGVTESFLSQVERDIASPSIATLRRIAVALGTDHRYAARQRRAAWSPGASR